MAFGNDTKTEHLLHSGIVLSPGVAVLCRVRENGVKKYGIFDVVCNWFVSIKTT
jgi:hypothetical protein